MFNENTLALNHLINVARQTMMGAKPIRNAIEDSRTNDHKIGNEIIHHDAPITSGVDVDKAIDHYRGQLDNHEKGSPAHTELTQRILPDLLKQRLQFDKNIHPRQLYNKGM